MLQLLISLKAINNSLIFILISQLFLASGSFAIDNFAIDNFTTDTSLAASNNFAAETPIIKDFICHSEPSINSNTPSQKDSQPCCNSTCHCPFAGHISLAIPMAYKALETTFFINRFGLCLSNYHTLVISLLYRPPIITG